MEVASISFLPVRDLRRLQGCWGHRAMSGVVIGRRARAWDTRHIVVDSGVYYLKSEIVVRGTVLEGKLR